MEVLPLNAIVYNQEKVNMADVVAPPYDVIDEKYQDELYSRSEYNCVRLILNKSEDRYTESAKVFNELKEKEILISFISNYFDSQGELS